MAIQHLTDEQVQTMTVQEKDRWWLENVYQGDVRQMTLRVAICGFVLGGLLSITNLYIGAKTGWSLGVGITSVILAFVIFRILNAVGMGTNYHVLENNILQSIATSAGYMSGPMISSMPAYMILTGRVIPWWQVVLWLLVLAILGVLYAFPLKRRFINDEQMPFPEGRAAGVVLDTLHSGASGSVLPAKLLVIFALTGGVLKFGQAHKVLERMKVGFLAVPEFLDEWYYRLAERLQWAVPSIQNVPLKELTIRPELDIAMIAAGGLMGIRTGVSVLVGAVINYCILAPLIINRGDIVGKIGPDGVAQYGFRAIVTWSLWCGVAMMTTASLVSFFAKPQTFVRAFTGLLNGRKNRTEDCLRHIELPLWVSLAGVPAVGLVTMLLGHWIFDVSYVMGAIAVPMVFVFALIAVNATGLTSITPTGPLGKITQLTYGLLAPGNVQTNIATASITGEVAGNTANLIQNIKPGYMLGAKPRLQAAAHIIGAFSGSLFSVVIFYAIFLRNNPAGLISAEYPYPAATIWKAVAELLTQGLHQLPVSARWATLIGGLTGIALEIVRMASKGRFPLSPVGLGLAFVISFQTCLAMFLGALIIWLLGRAFPRPEQAVNRTIVQNYESVCAGTVAGAALIGVGVMAIELFLLKG